MVFPAEAFEPLAVLESVSEERCTALHGVPTMFIAELEHPDFDSFDFSSLRTGIMAGAPCPIEVMRKVIDKMNMAEVTIAYGMTETSPVSFQSATDDPLEKRVATVGRVHPHVQVKIIDENGAVVPVSVTTSLDGASSISIIADKNATPLTAEFNLGPTTEGYVSTRIKMGKTANVVAVVKAGDKLYSAKKEVKVTIGGCGG